MSESERLIATARQVLNRTPMTISSIAVGAKHIYLLSSVYGLANDHRVAALRQRFNDIVAQIDGHPLVHQLEYASALATARGSLIYEEMHKLFSLCDEIHALRSLGFEADESTLRTFEANVRSRFASEREMARQVASERASNWSKNLWWYSENLHQ